MTDARPVSAAPAPPAPLGHRQILIAFSGLVLAMLLAALDSTIVSTALPTIVSELGGLEHLAWVVTVYLLAQTIVTPVYGKLGDLYGRKIVLQSAIVLFLIGSALCGLSQNMTQLIAFRAIQGLGGGGLVGDYTGGRRRHRPSAGSRAIPGNLRRGIRTREHRGSASGWILHDAPVLALDLLHQSPTRHRSARRACRNASVVGGSRRPLHRLRGRGTSRGGAERHHFPVGSGWDDVPVVVTDGNRVDRRVCPRARFLRAHRTEGRGAGVAASPFSAADVCHHLRGRIDRRVRPLRLGHLLPALSAGGEGRESHRLRPPDAAHDGRHAGDVDRVRPADQSDGALQDFSIARDSGDDPRVVPALEAHPVEQQCGGLSADAHTWRRSRNGDAGAGDCRPERRGVPRPRRRHIGRDALPVDRRIARHSDTRSDLRRATERESRAPAARRDVGRTRRAQHERAGVAQAPAGRA